MGDPIAKSAVTVNVNLAPIDHSDQPVIANYSTVGIAQGLAYLDFGFLEPAHLAGVVSNAQNGQAVPDTMNGTLVVRVAMGLDVVQRLHQQLQQVLVGVSCKQTTKP